MPKTAKRQAEAEAQKVSKKAKKEVVKAVETDSDSSSEEEAPKVAAKRQREEKKVVTKEAESSSSSEEEAPKKKAAAPKKAPAKAESSDDSSSEEEAPKPKAKAAAAKKEESSDSSSEDEAPKPKAKAAAAKKEESDSSSEEEVLAPKKAAKESKSSEEKADASGIVECFVRGLPYSATSESLAAFFKEVGPCTARVLTDRETGESRGMGFLTFENPEHAAKAVTWDGCEMEGRWLGIRLSEPKEGKGEKGGKSKGKGKGGKGGKGKVDSGPGEKPEGCTTVICGGLSYDTTEDSLWSFFEGIPSIKNVSIMKDRDTGCSKGVAFVDFEDSADTDEAVKKAGTELDGRTVSIRYKQPAAAKGEKGGKKGGNGKGKGKGKGKG